MPVPVGLNIWSRLVEKTFPYLDRVAGPFDSLWFPDHVQYGSHKVAEGWTLLACALERYPDKICGHEVLCCSMRNPAHLAKMAATAQILSAGRLVLGIGAGWNEEEYLAYNWPFPSARVRIAQLSEAIELIKMMWTQAPASYQGEYFRVENAFCEPRPDPVPPVMVGGSGERFLLRCVAQHADWWNYIFMDPATYTHKQEVLKAHCRAVGRDYDEIVQVVRVSVLIGETDQDVQRLQEQPWVRQMEGCIVGTPEKVTATLFKILDQGADRLSFYFVDCPRLEGTELFAATVLPHIKG